MSDHDDVGAAGDSLSGLPGGGFGSAEQMVPDPQSLDPLGPAGGAAPTGRPGAGIGGFGPPSAAHAGYPSPERPAPSGQHARPEPELGEATFRPTAPDAAPVTASAWSHVDSLRTDDLVPVLKPAPSRGWRRLVYRGSFRTINPGPSRDERRQMELESQIRALVRGNYKIGVLGKGGVGKTTVTSAVGSVFASLRSGDHVVAVDADTAFGRLRDRIDPNASGSYWELIADKELDKFSDIRPRVGANVAGLFVLAGEGSGSRRRVLAPEVYRSAARQLDRHFPLALIDCGSTMDHAVTREVLDDVDALILVSSPWADAKVAAQTLQWLANNGYTALANRTVVVINDAAGRSTRRARAELKDEFNSRGNTVIEIPFDEHLLPGGVVDLTEGLNPRTRRRFMELAAALAESFASTTESPRKRP